MNNKKGALMLLILLVLPLASAFELNSIENTASTCPGSTVLLTAGVFGSGDFTVNLDGTASSWATAVPQGFTINNQNKIIYTYITPPSSVSPGSYNLNLIVSNNIETKSVNYNVNVNNCRNLVLIGDLSKPICACNTDTLSFSLLNSGNYLETFDLSMQGSAEDWLILSQDSITLAPNEQKAIYIYASIPCDINSNNYGFALTAENTYLSAGINSNIQVNNCFDYDLITSRDYISMCDHSVEAVDLTISNKGSNTNKFLIDIDGPLFANTENTELIIDGLQSKATSLIFSPDYNIEGNFNAVLKVKSDYGDIQKQRNIIVDVRKCNSVLLEIPEADDKICSSLSKAYQGNIKNTGELAKEFRLETSEEWASLGASLVDLQPGQEQNFDIQISPPAGLSGNNKVYIRAIALDSDLISSEDYITIDVFSSEDCYKPDVQADNIELSQDGSATLPITIKNMGSQPATYILAISGTATGFIQLNPGTVTLEPGKSEIVYLYIAPSTSVDEGDYKITVSTILDEVILESETITIKVNEQTNQITGQIAGETPNFFAAVKNWIISIFTPKQTDIPQQTGLDQEMEEITEELEEEPIDTLEDINISGDLGEEASPAETQESVIEKTANAFDAYKIYLIYAMLGLIILIILIIIFRAASKSKHEEDSEEDFEEEPEKKKKTGEDEKPLKAGRWIVGIIILAAIVYLGYKYDWLTAVKNFFMQLWSYAPLIQDYVAVYKYYILGGLVILLIIILISKYWKNILDFFEEEDFEEKKPKRKKKK